MTLATAKGHCLSAWLQCTDAGEDPQTFGCKPLKATRTEHMHSNNTAIKNKRKLGACVTVSPCAVNCNQFHLFFVTLPFALIKQPTPLLYNKNTRYGMVYKCHTPIPYGFAAVVQAPGGQCHAGSRRPCSAMQYHAGGRQQQPSGVTDRCTTHQRTDGRTSVRYTIEQSCSPYSLFSTPRTRSPFRILREGGLPALLNICTGRKRAGEAASY